MKNTSIFNAIKSIREWSLFMKEEQKQLISIEINF